METRERAKNANFGGPWIHGDAELVWMMCYLLWEDHERRRLRDERDKHPEWIDLGGEGGS